MATVASNEDSYLKRWAKWFGGTFKDLGKSIINDFHPNNFPRPFKFDLSGKSVLNGIADLFSIPDGTWRTIKRLIKVSFNLLAIGGGVLYALTKTACKICTGAVMAAVGIVGGALTWSIGDGIKDARNPNKSLGERIWGGIKAGLGIAAVIVAGVLTAGVAWAPLAGVSMTAGIGVAGAAAVTGASILKQKRNQEGLFKADLNVDSAKAPAKTSENIDASVPKAVNEKASENKVQYAQGLANAQSQYQEHAANAAQDNNPPKAEIRQYANQDRSKNNPFVPKVDIENTKEVQKTQQKQSDNSATKPKL